MMRILYFVRNSDVHGRGLFAVLPISAGTELWRFQAPTDRRLPLETASVKQMHYGYVNPRRPAELVVCGDDARYWNFPKAGTAPNAIEGALDPETGEAVIIASRAIAAGEELLIDPKTDADASRKLNPVQRHAI